MIKLQAKRFELNFLLKFSDLKSNFTLTPGYLNPALNNRGQSSKTAERDSEITSILIMLTITMVIMILMKIIIRNKYMNYQRNVMQYYCIAH